MPNEQFQTYLNEKIEKAKKDILNNITISDSYDLNIPVVYEIIR